ncbi:MAG: endonuclease III [Anaerovoracaceae bacterium]|nr:endonuclease III [Anaerovoracaceae bacterium]
MTSIDIQEIGIILDILEEMYPQAKCALDHQDPFQLLVATVLSAQTTDISVNKVSGQLFEKFGSPFLLAKADSDEVAGIIKTIGLNKTKSKNIVALSKLLVEKYQGDVPSSYEELLTLPGVGRKTANVVLSVAFNQDCIAVDTHVFRVANRIGLTHGKTPLAVEEGLMKVVPKARWSRTHHSLIFHGRSICYARKPACEICPLQNYCYHFKLNSGRVK